MWKISADDICKFPIPLPPIDVQQTIVQQIQLERANIAREREEVLRFTKTVERESEEIILGIRPVPELVESRKLSA